MSNGPGDPAETGKYAVPVIQKVIDSGTPTFGICLGHQMLGLAVGAKTRKMHQGHHGANHPVKDETTGKVEITSMNHGFAVDEATLPKGATQTHVSLFDGSNCGIQLEGKPVFSVQYHPEASPGPRDFALSVQAVYRSDAREQAGIGFVVVIARSTCDEAIQYLLRGLMDCFAEPVIGRAFRATRWLAMTNCALCSSL